MNAQPANETLFQAVVVPHRSLSRRGLYTLIGTVCAASAVISTICFLLGAWPVAGFSGAEIALAVVLLRLNARAVRRSELIMMTPTTLHVIRTDANGARTERRLDAAWLNAVLLDRPARVPALLLRGPHEEIELARDLGETEKRTLAEALAKALHQRRHPVFDNPQLR